MFFNYIANKVGMYSVFAMHYERQGDNFYFKQEYEKATDAYIKAIYYGAGYRCKFHLASCYQKSGDLISASLWFDRAISMDSNYSLEARAKLNICNQEIIADAASHITEAENILDSQPNNALVKLSIATTLLVYVDNAEPLKHKALFLRRKAEWDCEKICIQSKVEQIISIEDLCDRVDALHESKRSLSLYKEYFSPEEKNKFEQLIELVKNTENELQKQRSVEMQGEVLLKIQEFLCILEDRKYNHAAHMLEQAIWLYRNPLYFADDNCIPVGKLESAKLELLEFDSKLNSTKHSKIMVIIDNVLRRLLEKAEKPLNDKKKIKDILWSILRSNWYKLNQGPLNELEDEMVNIINNNLIVSNIFPYVSAGVIFRGSVSTGVRDYAVLKAELEIYIESFCQAHKGPEVQFSFLQYLKDKVASVKTNTVENTEPEPSNVSSNNSLQLSNS